jgi:hypothetical protein
MNQSISVALIVLAFFASVCMAVPKNMKCCHGCGQYHCKKANSGDSCQQRPNYRGCWTECG